MVLTWAESVPDEVRARLIDPVAMKEDLAAV